ncbi:MAG: hypothetical protein JNL96_10115 [Planctomycetaceae bacterium]|nr:hypothetical protein [Planctomycetaceae bacterium]
MGILARPLGDLFVVTSDRTLGEAPTKTAPKRAIVDNFQIWTGERWSPIPTEAKTFYSLDRADDYIREHISQLMT